MTGKKTFRYENGVMFTTGVVEKHEVRRHFYLATGKRADRCEFWERAAGANTWIVYAYDNKDKINAELLRLTGGLVTVEIFGKMRAVFTFENKGVSRTIAAHPAAAIRVLAQIEDPGHVGELFKPMAEALLHADSAESIDPQRVTQRVAHLEHIKSMNEGTIRMYKKMADSRKDQVTDLQGVIDKLEKKVRDFYNAQ